MHRAYDIPNHEFRYVLSTFVVVPKRWLDDYGKRPLTAHEVEASVQYYRTLGRHMNIKDIPETYAGFEELMDSYEAEHFAYDEGGRRVADSTLALMVGFQPRIARPVMGIFSRSLMDPPLRAAFRYDDPPAAVVALSRGALKARGLLLRAFPARQRPEADRGPAADPQLSRRLRHRAARHLPGAGRRRLPGARTRRELRLEPRRRGGLRRPATHQRPVRSSVGRPAPGCSQRAGEPGVAEEPLEGRPAPPSVPHGPRPTGRRTPARR